MAGPDRRIGKDKEERRKDKEENNGEGGKIQIC